MVFAVAGYVLCNPDWGVLELDVETAAVESLVEVTLALLLFSGAARVNVRELRRDVGLPVRLLGIGLPLSVLAGAGLAAGLMPELPWALAGFLGAALAPTDAALSGAVINDERLPIRLRRSLNVESGLNDGMATPIVTVMLAIAASQLGEAGGSEAIQAGTALRELGVGVLVGVAVGICGASAVNWAARRAWIAPGGRRLAALALALGAFMLSTAIEGNGFVAAFVAGIAFGAVLAPDAAQVARSVELPELGGEVLALVVWFLFGGALVPIALGDLGAQLVVYVAQSHDRSDGAGGPGDAPLRAGPLQRRLPGVVRSPRTRLDRVRAARHRIPRGGHRHPPCGRRRHAHRVDERRPPRLHRHPGGPRVPRE